MGGFDWLGLEETSYSMGQHSDTWPQLMAKKTGKQDSYMFRRKGKQIW